MASPPTNRDISPAGRTRGTKTVTAAEKAQAREVSLRRIGQLFKPYTWQLTIVTAIIVASSIVGVASPFLLRAVIDTALPDRNLRLLILLLLPLIGVVAAVEAAGRGAEQAVMAGIVTGDAADRRAFQAALGVGSCRRHKRERGDGKNGS